MSGQAAASQQSTSSTYAGKAHEHVPEFTGKATDYKEYRKRLMLYEKKMALAGRGTETSFNVLCTLKGRAWDACEDISMSDLEGSSGMAKIYERLDKIFKFDAITELPGDFEAFFCTLQRRKNSTLQEYAGDFERALRKLEAHNVNLPDKVIGWYFMRRAGLTQSQRQMIMSSIGTETLSLDTVRKAMNFVIGQDSLPHHDGPGRSSGRWQKTPYTKDSVYYEEEYENDDDDEADDGGDCYWADGDEGEEYEDEEIDDEVHVAQDDLAAEYDDVMVNYSEARQKLNQMRMSRGYYPVVAMVPEQPSSSGKGSYMSYKGKGSGGGKGKGKSGKSKGKGGGQQRQAPKPPSAKARGRAVLGAEKCLRCGQAGHRAKACPVAGTKRKADSSLEADVNMVSDTVIDIQLTSDEAIGSSDDVAMMDCGAGSVLTSEEQLKKYLKVLMASGFEVGKIPVFRCKKGFRFGNGEKNITSVCLLVPTFMEGHRRDILMYVIPGKAPFLFGRPILEALDISIGYANGKIKWGKKAWKSCLRGSRGEFLCHMAADIGKLLKREPSSVLLPDDFDQHVHPEILSTDIFFDGKSTEMLNVTEEEVQSVMGQQEQSSFTAVSSILDTPPKSVCEKSATTPSPSGVTPTQNSVFVRTEIDLDPDDEIQDSVKAPELDPGQPREHPCEPEMSPTMSPTRSPEPTRCNPDPAGFSKLPGGKLRQLLHDTERRIKEFEDVLQASPLRDYNKKYVLWEVFAGQGRVTQTANRRQNLCAERFSLEDGWDFTQSSHRVAFLRRLRHEEPDAVLLSPVCKLWSQLQELTVASKEGYGERLEELRQWDHDNVLMFCAIVYEHQRRNGRLALCEHPLKSRAWKTQAFESMQGYDARVDQCMFGLRMPNDDNVILPVQKPTNFRVTGSVCYEKLQKTCDGSHKHTHLEGSIPGVGLRSWLAESYPQALASRLVDAILAELECNYESKIFAVGDEDDESEFNPVPLPEGDVVEQGSARRVENLESDEFQALDPVRRNRVLRAQVGPRAVEYVQRLHKNLGHPGWEVLHRMLREVQATENVLQAAKFYTCPLCYARKPPKQSPPASGLKCTEFNDRILVDSHWISCEDSMVKERVPAPGTPAARRREKDKKEKRPTGRQCVLTIIDHATRYCSIRILQSEKAEEFTKGLERAWVKHFGVPKVLRIDEAKGWSSTHVREWAAQRGITLEVQPAENHTWLGVVERKHQVVRRALELYMDQCGSHNLSALKEAALYVPHSINQLSFHRGFTPQQWVLGKSMTYVHGLSGEIFNPAQEAIDEQGAFAAVQARRAQAAKAFISADSDAKLRRAFNQKFSEMQEELVIGQRVWYWRKNLRRLQKSGWRGPARIVAIEEQPNVNVYWLCHGTSLLRCGARQVRPMVEDTGMPVEPDRQAALRDLQELKARSTTQFKDELRRSGHEVEAEELGGDDVELEAEYSPSVAPREEVEERNRRIAAGELPEPPDLEEPETDRAEEDDEMPEETVPGVVHVFLPRLTADDRERTPRRRESVSTAAPTEVPEPPASLSPKRKSSLAASLEEPAEKQARSTALASTDEPMVSTDLAGETVPVPDDQDLVIEDVYFAQLPEDAPSGWRLVDGCIEMDDVLMAAIRKGEVDEKKLSPDGRAQFVEGKRKELDNYFSNAVWKFALTGEIEDAIKNKRVISARWVLTWKKVDSEDGVVRWKAKSRLVLRGFQDPDILSMKTAAPTAGRTSRTFLLTTAVWFGWDVFCADVQAAFLSGKGFDRVLIVRLPMDCLPLIDGAEKHAYNKHVYMKMQKSAYGLCDAPLLWYEEAASRLTKRQWIRHPLDSCCFMLVSKKTHTLCGLLILHVDDMLLTGSMQDTEFQQAVDFLRSDFKFGKWDQLSPKQPLKYCGGTISQSDYGIEVSYEEYIKKICPMQIAKGRKESDDILPAELSAARGLIGALQWPATQGLPILCASMSIQAGEVPKGQVHHLRELNKSLRFAKANAATTLKFIARPEKKQKTLDNLCLVCYADAAFCVRSDKSSQGGYVIMACEKGVLKGLKRPASIISWRSFKVPRVCRSSLAAECQSCATALEELLMSKTFLELLKRPSCSLQQVKDDLTGDCAMVTDCKALYDSVHRETVQAATDKRVAIESLVIKDLLRDLNCEWRWVSSERQLSDGLTKVGARQSFVERYRGSYVQLIADSNFTASKKKSKEERAKTVAETRISGPQVAQALVALVMSSEAVLAEGSTRDDWNASNDAFILEDWKPDSFYVVLVTIIIGVMTVMWWFGRLMVKMSSLLWSGEDQITLQKKKILELEEEKKKDENEKLKLYTEKSKMHQMIMRLQDSERQLKLVNDELREENQRLRGSSPAMSSATGAIYVTPSGDCWHRRAECAGNHSSRRRPCLKCSGGR